MKKFIISTVLLFSVLTLGAQGFDSSLEKVNAPRSMEQKIITHINYTSSFNTRLMVPNYVSWSIEPEELQGQYSRRDVAFSEDPKLGKDSPSPMDYSRSGWDRGHMCPAADNKYSLDAMRESFYMSNMCPQDHSLNEKAWNNLENACRNWARQTPVYVVCGPYFNSRKPKTHIGNNRVAVPDGFWKVVLRYYKGAYRGIGFLFENKPYEGSYKNAAVTIDEIEKMTGLDFFSALNDKAERTAESSFDIKMWP